MSNLKKLRSVRSKYATGANLEFGAVASALSKSGGIKSKARRMLNCSAKTLNEFIEQNPDINEVIREARQDTVGLAHEKLLEKLHEGNMSAIKIVLTTLGKEDFSTRQEITGANGAPMIEFNTEDANRLMKSLMKDPNEEKAKIKKDND